MPIPYRSRPRPEPRIATCSVLLRKLEGDFEHIEADAADVGNTLTSRSALRTLCIDIGGTGIKMIVLDPQGNPVNERARELTPKPATWEAVLAVINSMIRKQPHFDRISVGYPGVVIKGRTLSAANLDPSWIGQNLQAAIEASSDVPTRVVNDADLQGFGVIEGKGVEMVLTLGTGVGSALFINGHLVPNLELGHHPFQKDKTYEERLSDAELKEQGRQKWSKRVGEMITLLSAIFNYDHLYIGGGNAEHIKVELPRNVSLFDNVDGMTGGIRLWADAEL